MAQMTVDEFIEANVPPEQRNIVEMLRALMREYAPAVTEVFTYSLPMYKARELIAFISPNKKDIKFSFIHGVHIDDKFGLLKGKAKWSRYVAIKDPQKVNMEALRYYIQQAIDLDAKSDTP
ncbi:MAG: DUF1801 domain-containing protein [Anaerolineae bacterium]